MLHVGLTGNIAAGKSTVAALFRGWGATIIDADQLVREAQAPGSPVLAAIAARFGAGDVRADGALDRAGAPGLRAGAIRAALADAQRASCIPRCTAAGGSCCRGARAGRPDRGQRHPPAVRGGRSVGVRRRGAGGRARAGPPEPCWPRAASRRTRPTG